MNVYVPAVAKVVLNPVPKGRLAPITPELTACVVLLPTIVFTFVAYSSGSNRAVKWRSAAGCWAIRKPWRDAGRSATYWTTSIA